MAICSKKLSAQAFRWKTIEKEGFGIFYSVKKFSDYLCGKFFIIKTYHIILVWMEASYVGKIVRWRIYLQDYNLLVRHIPGKHNVVADCLSRLLNVQWYESHCSSKKKISARFDLNDQSYAFDNYLVFAWGSCKQLDPATMILVDDQIAARFPKIVEAYMVTL
jgi:hypothetical protein